MLKNCNQGYRQVVYPKQYIIKMIYMNIEFYVNRGSTKVPII